jgi:hypothetical protein
MTNQIFYVFMYTQMNSKVGFWQRQLGNKFLVFTRALLSSNGRSLQTQKSGTNLTTPKTDSSGYLGIYGTLKKKAVDGRQAHQPM